MFLEQHILEDTYNLKKDKSLTTIQSFIRVREKRVIQINKQVIQKSNKSNKIEESNNNMTSTAEDLLAIVNKFRNQFKFV